MDENIQISKEIEEVKSKYKKKKIISAILLGIILIVGIYFYFQTGVPSESNKSPETPKETVSSEGEPLPPLSEQVIESNITEKPLPPLSEVPEKGTGEEKPLPPLSE